jgi:cyclomaltodextrinase / maltogenic alpha-amylase / neopullulanase
VQIGYLRRVGLAALLAAACSSQGRRVPALETHGRKPVQAHLEIEGADADVWAWEISTSAKLVGPAALERCAFEVNGEALSAEIIGNRLYARLRLAPGKNAIRARCTTDGGELLSGIVSYVVRLVDRPRAQASASRRGGKLVLDGGASLPGEFARAPLVRWQWWSRTSLERTAELPVGEGATLDIPLPAARGEHRYRLRVEDTRGASDEASVSIGVDGDGVLVESSSEEQPSFLDEAIVYGVVPAFFEGVPLRGATDALANIADLGVTAVWVSPLFGTLPGDFGYAVTDYEHVRRDYGTAADLRAFISAAHRRNLRVLLDFVPNHTSREHPYFRQAEAIGSRSHYFDFFERDAEGRATHYFDWEHLPNLRYANPEVGRWMTEIAAEWVRAFEVDGYRVDAAWGVARRRPDHWPRWSAELRRIDPEIMLVAEASAYDPFYLSHGFDAAYDWGDELGKWAWQDVFTTKRGTARRLHEAVMRSVSETGRADRVMRFLNNNDTGERFITRHGEDMTRVATGALLTLPGIPCLYAFDEVGAEFEPYAGLRPVRAAPRPSLREFHEKLIRLRRATPALRGRGFTPLPLDPEHEVYTYVREGRRAGEVALVALNFGPDPAPLRVTLPPAFAAGRSRAVRDLLSRRSFVTRARRLSLTLGAWEVLILVPDRA